LPSASLPKQAEDVIDNALVCVLTCINKKGKPVAHPMLPLYDRNSGKIYFTSSVLFSRKLRYIKRNPKVSVLFSNKKYIRSDVFHVVLVKWDAKIIEDDIHHGWEKLLPLWRKKEPYIDQYLKQRIAIPLFWERVIIEVTPRRVYLWENGDILREPAVYEVSGS
jgi:general stress protein 26